MPTILTNPHIVKTRKNHYCHGCRVLIGKGEKAEHSTHTCDGEIYSLYECQICMALVKLDPDCRNEDYGEGFQVGYIREYFGDAPYK